jgi:hypothetical protein
MIANASPEVARLFLYSQIARSSAPRLPPDTAWTIAAGVHAKDFL